MIARPAWKDAGVTTFNSWRIIRGDRVQVLSGKAKGQRGMVKRVMRTRNMVIIEGANLVKKHQAGQGEMKGGIYSKEAPVPVSQVALLDPKDDQPCRTKWVFLEDGTKARQSKRSGLIIPKNDLVLKGKKASKSGGVDGVLDTPPEIATKSTFSMSELVPKLNWNKQ